MNIADALSRWANEKPYAVAIVDGDLVVHYWSFDRAAWRAAAWFRAQGVKPGDIVGTSFAQDSALQLVAIYGLARMGAVQISMPLWGSATRSALAHQFGVSSIVGEVDAASLADLPLLRPDPRWLGARRAAIDPSVRSEGDDAPWLIALSSGTTGAVKGVYRTHRDHLILTERAHRQHGHRSGDRFLAAVSLSYIFGFYLALEVIDSGGTVRLVPPAADIAAVIDREAINRMATSPGAIKEILSQLSGDRPRFPGIRSLAVGTALVSQALSEEMRRRLTPHAFVIYGANELWYLTIADPATQVRFPESVGFPFPGIEIEIVDDAGRRLPPGEIGLIRLRGAGFPTAYINNPEATAQVFRDGWFYIGDVGSLTPEGALYLKGRADDVMNLDGIKIYPADIEATLLQHPAVAEAAAFPLHSKHYSDVPAVAVVLRSETSVEALLAYCRERLGVKAPQRLHILPELPKNAMGKVVKRTLIASLPELDEGPRKTPPPE